MHNVSDADIQQAVDMSGLQGYTSSYTELGGGEINDTFILNFADSKVILRISRHPSSWMLGHEAHALQLMNFNYVPKLIYFDSNKKIRDRLWIIESFVMGEHVERLNLSQFSNLGNRLARIHKIIEPSV